MKKHSTPHIIGIIILVMATGLAASLNAQQNVPGMVLNNKSLNANGKGLVEALPLFNKSLKKNNFSSPLAFGMAISALMYQQEYVTKNLRVRGTLSNGEEEIDIYARGGSIDQNTIAGEFKVYLKPNFWVFPFLNIYGLFGYTSGQISPNLIVNGIIIENPFEPGDLLTIDTSFVLNDKIKYSGSTFGVGASLSFGFKNMVILLDYNYTTTNPSDLDGKLINHFLSPKIAWIINTQANNFKTMIWVGSLFLSNNQSFKGDINIAEISPELIPVFGEVAEYIGTIEAKHKWNFIIGSTFLVGKHHSAFVEIGFANRLQATIGYGFMF